MYTLIHARFRDTTHSYRCRLVGTCTITSEKSNLKRFPKRKPKFRLNRPTSFIQETYYKLRFIRLNYGPLKTRAVVAKIKQRIATGKPVYEPKFQPNTNDFYINICTRNPERNYL